MINQSRVSLNTFMDKECSDYLFMVVLRITDFDNTLFSNFTKAYNWLSFIYQQYFMSVKKWHIMEMVGNLCLVKDHQRCQY